MAATTQRAAPTSHVSTSKLLMGIVVEVPCATRIAGACVTLTISGGNGGKAIPVGCGSCAIKTATGGNVQRKNAVSAPSHRRTARRSRKTSASEKVSARIANHSEDSQGSRLLIIKLLQQLFQVGNILAAQLALLGEVRNQRRNAPVEQTVEQALAFLGHVLLPRELGRIQVAPPFALGPNGLFLQQAVEQRFDRALLPALLGADLGQDVLGTARRLAPEHLHDYRFGFTDRHRSPFTCVSGTNNYIRKRCPSIGLQRNLDLRTAWADTDPSYPRQLTLP